MKRWICILTLLAAVPIRADDARVVKPLSLPEDQARTVLERWAERHPDSPPEPLIEAIRRASAAGAPAELVADKAVEGLAKGVPPQRLFRVLDTWGRDLGRAAQTVREIRRPDAVDDIPEREAILRMSVIQRLQHSGAWLDGLKEAAQSSQADLRDFLNVGEAMGHLTGRLGLQSEAASQLGAEWLRHHASGGDIGKHLRAIEAGRDAMPVGQATRMVVDQIRGGASPDDILKAVQVTREADGPAPRPGAVDERPAQEREAERADAADRGESGSDGGKPGTTGRPEDKGGKGRGKGKDKHKGKAPGR